LKKLNELETLKKNALESNIIRVFNPFSIEELAKITFAKNDQEKIFSHSINFDSLGLTAKTGKTRFEFKKHFPMEKSSDVEEKKKTVS